MRLLVICVLLTVPRFVVAQDAPIRRFAIHVPDGVLRDLKTRLASPRIPDPVAHGGRAEDAFDVVIPSIPGFAFSDKPREPGYDHTRIAAIEAKLMARLG